MSIILENLSKRFGAQNVVKDVSLEIADGELFVLLGSSGSGKSTILRMIAGLTSVDGGRVLLRGRDVTQLPPQIRGTGFVFQNYSIFRHMSVLENIEFGLKIRKVPKAERLTRCEELLDLVGLAGLGDRYAHQISGGQQQRVALARALAYEPSVLLLDEPLGALDVKIRIQLRRSLKEIQRRLKVTTVLVTHDQEEAYELADHIGVLERGVLLEVGPPEQLYVRPKTLYVAGFLGAGTVLAGRVINGQARFGTLAFSMPNGSNHEEAASVELLTRPEQVILTRDQPEGPEPVLGKGSVTEQTFLGGSRRVRLRLPRLAGTRQISPATSFGEEGMLVDAVVPTEMDANGEFWVTLRKWAILDQAQPNILSVDIGSGSAATLQLTRLLAEPMQAAVTVLGFADRSSTPEFKKEVERRAHEHGLKEAEVQTATGDLIQQVAVQCSRVLFELMVMPANLTAANSGLQREVLTLLERADTPVIVVNENGHAQIRRVLICTRAGEPGKNDIQLGGRLARYLGATVTLLHVTTQTLGATTQAQRHLRDAAATLRAAEVPNETLILPHPHPASAILEQAAQHDLLVIGGHGPQSRSIFGRDDVAVQVLKQAACPVLVVPSELV